MLQIFRLNKMFPVEEFIDDVVSKSFPKFEYRDNQKETIVDIINSFINNKKQYVLLDAPTGCIHGDTLIRLTDGTSKPIKDLVGKSNFYVISSTKSGSICPGKVLKVWKTKTTSDLVKVVFDDDSSVVCTPCHRFMLRDGSYKRAEDLSESESLMPMYIKHGKDALPTRDSKGRSLNSGSYKDRNCIFNPETNTYEYLAELIKKSFEDLPTTGKFNIHHIDGDIYNDNPDNLEILSISEHTSLHLKEYHKDKSNPRLKALLKSNQNSEKQSKSALSRFYDKDGNRIEEAFSQVSNQMSNLNKNNDTKINQQKGKVLKSIKTYLNSGKLSNQLDMTIEDLVKNVCDCTGLDGYSISAYRIKKYFGENIQVKELLNIAESYNHSVKRVEKISEEHDVFDMEVEKYHNFGIETSNGSGIIIHNSGKSWIARIVAEVMNCYYENIDNTYQDIPESLFITKTIALQDQYLRDFPEIAKLMGASNYDCHTDQLPPIPLTAKYHPTCRYNKSSGLCSYHKAKKEYKESALKNLNYAFYFNGNSLYNTPGLLIADEAHNLADYLIEHSSVIINFTRLSRISLEFDIRDYVDILDIEKRGLNKDHCKGLYAFCAEVRDFCKRILESSLEKAEMLVDENLLKIIEDTIIPLEENIDYLNKICKIVALVNQSSREFWVFEQEESKRDIVYKIIPVVVLDYSLNILRVPRHVLMMSATIGRLAVELCLDTDEYDLISMPYSYPLENRPFIQVTDLPPMNYQTRDTVIGKYIEYIDNFLDNSGDVSGIIHTASYKNAQELLKFTRHKNRIYIPDSIEVRNLKEVIKPGMMIAHPAILEGVDLPGDLASYQFFMKVPYPSLSSEWVCRKKDMDKGWYDFTTIKSVIQGSGRIIRNKDDFGVTFMMDPSFTTLLARVRDKVPDWFKETIIS